MASNKGTQGATMKITSIRRRGRTITIKGSFQRADLRHVLELANTGQLALTPEAPERQPLLVDLDRPEASGLELDARELWY
jgi:hypothetical protein